MKKIVIKTKPISVNQMYRGRRFLTNDGKATKEAISWEVATQFKETMIEDSIKITVHFYFENRRMDIDNCLKGLFDCLTGLVWKDDRYVDELHVFKYIDKENPRTELFIQ